MDCAKIGTLIARLRREKGLTQQAIAQALGVSNKTVSKWECGLGCPDLEFWPQLSAILGVDMARMMEGEIAPSRPDSGNMDRVKLYACTACGNVLAGTGPASIFCCGRKLEPLTPRDEAHRPPIGIEESDGDLYITAGHPMTKDHHLAFAAYVHNERMTLIRLYPEQNPSFRLPLCRGGRLYLYCTQHGLSLYEGCFKRQSTPSPARQAASQP